MPRQIKISLSVGSVREAQKQLEQYKKDLIAKCEKFCRRLADKGITVAKQNVGEYGQYITFAIQTEPTAYGAKGVLYATSGLVTHEWVTATGVMSADVSPLLMAEFGSGLRGAINPRAGEFGMGVGTFPGQTHAEDPSGWWYQTLDGVWHHSYGEEATMPMTRASAEMIDQIVTTAKEVFGT